MRYAVSFAVFCSCALLAAIPAAAADLAARVKYNEFQERMEAATPTMRLPTDKGGASTSYFIQILVTSQGRTWDKPAAWIHVVSRADGWRYLDHDRLKLIFVSGDDRVEAPLVDYSNNVTRDAMCLEYLTFKLDPADVGKLARGHRVRAQIGAAAFTLRGGHLMALSNVASETNLMPRGEGAEGPAGRRALQAAVELEETQAAAALARAKSGAAQRVSESAEYKKADAEVQDRASALADARKGGDAGQVREAEAAYTKAVQAAQKIRAAAVNADGAVQAANEALDQARRRAAEVRHTVQREAEARRDSLRRQAAEADALVVE